MSNENTGEIENESNLLQSTVVTQINMPISTHNFDDLPIGGKKFQFSQFPEEGQEVKKPRQPFKPRASKTVKPPDSSQVPIPNQSSEIVHPDQRPIGTKSQMNFDDMPIGSGKQKQMSEYPEEGQAPKPPKKPVKPKLSSKPASKPIKKEAPNPNIDEQPISGGGGFDEQPIGGGNKMGFDEQPIGGGKKEGFDEQPIGKTPNNFMMSQFPEGDEQAPVQTNYTMSQKLKSKAVKLRLSGFEDLFNLLQNDPKSEQLLDVQIGKLLKETNPACLEKILQCFKLWVQKDKKWGDDEAKVAIEGGYINGKPNTKKLTVQITDLMFQKAPDAVQMTLMVGLKGKVPKTLAGYLSMINEILAIYGMKKMKYMKPYMPDIVTVLNRQKLVAVKTQGMNLLKQCYKWLSKDVMDPLLKDLKQNLKKQLDSFWQSYDKSQVMTAPKDIAEEGDGKATKKIDAYELSEAVDIFKKFNEKYSEQVIKQEKWSQKVKLMQQFVNAANVPKIANTQHRHITQMIRRLINHSNFNVVLWDLKILAVLSRGLRRPFYPVVKSLFSNVIGKFRDKKTQMVEETFNTLNQFSYCISIEDVIEDVKQGLGDKAPNMKVNLINWIGKFVEKKVDENQQLPDKTAEALKNLFPTFQKLLTDGVADVRDTMVKNIGKMKILLGDDFFSQVDKKMSKGQASKIIEVKEKMPARKISKQKQPKINTPSKNSKVPQKKIQTLNAPQTKGKQEINQQIALLLPKLNHSDWQKRKQSAQSIINLLQGQERLNIACLNDFLNTLKQRIADPNKNIIKYFVNLTGIVFGLMCDKDVKANAKNFICALADGLSDKVQANRREICTTLNKLGDIYGKQYLLTILGSYLDSDKDLRLEVIRVILENEEYLQKADTKEYPKGLIRCLCDRNKQIRKEAEKLFEKIQQKTGLDVFKNLARNQRPAIAKDLNTLFSKYQGNCIANNSSMISKGPSPPKKVPPLSNKKATTQRSLGKSNAAQRSFDKDLEQETQPMYATMNNMSGSMLKQTLTYVQGNDQFAPLKILASERVLRQQKDQRYPWMCDNILESQEEELIDSFNCLFKPELSKKMLSLDYRKVIDAASDIIKLCKDISHQNQIRQVNDLLFKWVFMRLWGGNPAVHSIIQVLPPVMSILQKKKLAMNDGQVDIIVAILREYFITGYMNEYKVSESLYTITKCLIALSSGDRLLKKILVQFGIQLPSIHRHIKKQATAFYREGLSKLIKSKLVQYIGNGSTLEEASKIKELKNDPQFVDILYKRFHENILDSFGFRHARQSHKPQVSEIQPPFNNSKVYANNEPAQKTIQKAQQHHLSPQNVQRTRTPTRTIQKGHNQNLKQQQLSRSFVDKSKVPENTYNQIFDISMLQMPHQASPLGKNLARLMPPNDNTISFFNNLFVESGQKISNELIAHAKIIFGSILKSVIEMLDNRTDYPPQKIFNQVTLLQQSIKCRYIIRNIGEYLYFGTKFALSQLVYEDENKSMIMQDLVNRGYDFKVQQFIKVINGVMLRILENACPQQSVNVLLRLLNSNLTQPNSSQKTFSLIIKCLSRVSNSYSPQIQDKNSVQFFRLVLQYLASNPPKIHFQDFNPSPDQRLRPQQNILKTLKSIINDLIKHYGSDIWIHYQESLKNKRVEDQYIAVYFQFLGIPYPDNIHDEMNQEEEALKEINDLLSKTKTFDRGIDELRRYVKENEGFSPAQYFNSRGYDQKFIIMVMNALERERPKRTPTKRELRQQKSQNSRRSIEPRPPEANIQDRIQKLKKRFDDNISSQNDQKPSIPVAPSTNNRINQDDRSQERALQIKRRIDEMKNRMTRR